MFLILLGYRSRYRRVNDLKQFAPDRTPRGMVETYSHSHSPKVLVVHHRMKASLQTVVRTLICR
jgi:hypothetical protein